jgi:hypothetical protein
MNLESVWWFLLPSLNYHQNSNAHRAGNIIKWSGLDLKKNHTAQRLLMKPHYSRLYGDGAGEGTDELSHTPLMKALPRLIQLLQFSCMESMLLDMLIFHTKKKLWKKYCEFYVVVLNFKMLTTNVNNTTVGAGRVAQVVQHLPSKGW